MKEFAYGVPRVRGKAFGVFNPYDLKIVEYSEIEKGDAYGYYTISRSVCRERLLILAGGHPL